jgi:hypothetical protein
MEAIGFSETSVPMYPVAWRLDTTARTSYTSSKLYSTLLAMEGPNQESSYRGASGTAAPVGRTHGATKWTEKLVF